MLSSLDHPYQKGGGIGFSLQAVITKVDAIPLSTAQTRIQKMKEQITLAAPTCLPPILTSTRDIHVGIEELRHSISDACAI